MYGVLFVSTEAVCVKSTAWSEAFRKHCGIYESSGHLTWRRYSEMLMNLNEKLDHIPSSCIVLLVHMVNGRQYSAYTYTSHIDAGAEMVSETDSRPRQWQVSMLQSHSAVQLLNFSLVVTWRVLYIAQGSLYLYTAGLRKPKKRVGHTCQREYSKIQLVNLNNSILFALRL
jgi:hypothetical protein